MWYMINSLSNFSHTLKMNLGHKSYVYKKVNSSHHKKNYSKNEHNKLIIDKNILFILLTKI